MRLVLILFIFILTFPVQSMADWKSVLGNFMNKKVEQEQQAQSTFAGRPTYPEKVGALKQALSFGIKYAINNLSKPNGFLANPKVRIPVPDKLKGVASFLRKAHQGRLVDNFVEQMNHAAEKATPKTFKVFSHALRQMTISDATQILKGKDTAATEYFKSKTYAELVEIVKPIIKESTSKTKTTMYYKRMVEVYKKYKTPFSKMQKYSSILKGRDYQRRSQPPEDLDDYIAQKTVDGIFKMIAEEEIKIRKDPLERSTKLLKKVFGSLSK
ncbi:DUF4197 domain-containing protein [Hippea maritima]|uniref:DUF4197 domain-containing protein n=1 Tax=Hippea maritima (strain ATCC 700847 / DSM 10411 / MH2) TaxID=760142 RepID=F2LTN5_HIPMA|nr:DUF4197 domain-containing protein [Hippea maritima]AEA33360.1 hypothetical protein Hipma_0384 [Hippea maritima DSM 10411]